MRTRRAAITSGMLRFVVCVIVVGVVAGLVARALVTHRGVSTFSGAVLLGTLGSLLGGFTGYALTHRDADDGFQPSCIIGSIIGAVIALIVHHAATGPGRGQVV